MDKHDYRVVTFLKREELDFLDSMGKDIYFTHGVNIPRSKLIEELIQTFKDMDENKRKDIEEQILKMFKKPGCAT